MEPVIFKHTLEPVELRIQGKYPLRDPLGDAPRYDSTFWVSCSALNGEYQRSLAEQGLPSKAGPAYLVNALIYDIQRRLILMYARGEPLDKIVHHIVADLPFTQELKEIFISRDDAEEPFSSATVGVLKTNQRSEFRFLALVLLLAPEKDTLTGWLDIFHPRSAYIRQGRNVYLFRSFYTEALIKAFAPDWPMAARYEEIGLSDYSPVMHALYRALALPSQDARTCGMVDYMVKWNSLMKRYGWKSERHYCPLGENGAPVDQSGRYDNIWVEFAFEAALAVCAYDLDDTAFRDHLYYPRDLVDHYRTHLRQTRDAWRSSGIGPGFAVQPPPAPKKNDLARSKQKHYARWLELVCDGDKEAWAAVIEATGKPRSLKQKAAEVMMTLASAGQGVAADIKDADTLAVQLDRLLDGRGLEGFAAPAEPPAGPARCERLMQVIGPWVRERGYVFVPYDAGDDAWYAVMVAAPYWDEWRALSRQLGLVLAE